MKRAAILASVAAGGALGAVARHWAVAHVPHWPDGAVPIGTIAVNIAGSLAFGIVIGLIEGRMSVPHEFRAFLLVGMLGAFTTFSTLALDIVLLIESEYWLAVVQYIVVSIVFGIVMLFAGLAGIRAVRRRWCRLVDAAGILEADCSKSKSD